MFSRLVPKAFSNKLFPPLKSVIDNNKQIETHPYYNPLKNNLIASVGAFGTSFSVTSLFYGELFPTIMLVSTPLMVYGYHRIYVREQMLEVYNETKKEKTELLASLKKEK